MNSGNVIFKSLITLSRLKLCDFSVSKSARGIVTTTSVTIATIAIAQQADAAFLVVTKNMLKKMSAAALRIA